MRKEDCIIGGEQSGHIVWADRATTGDGVLAALFLLEVVIEKQKRLSELRKVIEKFLRFKKVFCF